MAISYKNVTGSKLIVQNEFSIPISFAVGETKSSAIHPQITSYLERFTSAYLSAPEILLERVGNLDGTEGNEIRVPNVRTDNMVSRAALPARGTEGVQWGAVGGDRRTGVSWAEEVVPAGYADDLGTDVPGLADNSLRLHRVGFNTQFDTPARQIDTRFVGCKSIGDLGITLSAALGSAATQVAGNATIKADLTKRGLYYVTYTGSGRSVYSILILTADGVLEVGYDTTAVQVEVDFVAWA